MTMYVKPKYSARDVNDAGEIIRRFRTDEGISRADIKNAISVIDNFRASHQFPLNTFYMTLKNRASRVSPRAFVSQRNKRFPSIVQKLWDRPTMNLTQMQDIGGCRAVVPTIKQVYELRDTYFRRKLVHPFAGLSSGSAERDYVMDPKDSGYRSLHLKFRFNGRDRSAAYTGLRIEMQIRTELQHKWATAVETAGTFSRMALKSNKGSPHWLRFFALMGSIFAQREGMPPVPGTTEANVIAEIKALNRKHYIAASFEQYRAIIPRFENRKDDKYFLVVLDPVKPEVLVKGFARDAFPQANTEYADMERYYGEDSPVQIVLVSVEKVSDVMRAYPSFFLDTEDFLREVRAIIDS